MQKIDTFIQIRMGSQRLPGKALLKIRGKTALCRLIERIQKSSYNNIVISTTCNPGDEEIIKACTALGVDYFRGDEVDCLDRFIKTAECFNSNIIVRVTGDNLFTDPIYIDRVVLYLLENTLDYAGVKGLPLGAGAEVVTLETLKKVSQLTKDIQHREHITSFIYSNDDMFKVGFIKPENECLRRPDLRLTMDTKEDFVLVKKIYEYLGDFPTLSRIIDLIDSHRELKNLNSFITQRRYDFKK